MTASEGRAALAVARAMTGPTWSSWTCGLPGHAGLDVTREMPT